MRAIPFIPASNEPSGCVSIHLANAARVKANAACCGGFDHTVAADNKGRDKRGLDCSDFVQWIVWRVTDVKLGSSTSTITSGMGQITAAELQPGDLGLMAFPGAASNHVGIFVGCDESGRALWCHENSSAGNVSVDATACFKYYFRMF